MAGHIDQYAPRGSPGLDGWTGADLSAMDDDSKSMLALLLNYADDGKFPEFWGDARTVGIPKNDGTPDRRPLTVLAAAVRLWARRAARHTSLWLHRYMPPEIYGARPGTSAADAAWDLQLDVDEHRTQRRQLYVMTMDQKQCFDRLSLASLHQLAVALGFPRQALHALNLYARLQRFLWIDGQPTGHILAGHGLRGIPQGCPLAVHFCNCTSWAWQLFLQFKCNGVRCCSFLDDRLLRATIITTIVDALAATALVDAASGALLNIKNTKMVVYAAPSGLRLQSLV